ncbi:H-NS histone (plasmid) [Stutzerimonas degradans]|nr:H-NS histone [Stutzerimonas degradans]
MSLITEYRDTEKAIAELKARLEAMNNDERLIKEIEFEEKLRALMGEYQRSLRDIINILDPEAAPRTAAVATKKRAERKVKTYVNPNTNESIQTKGGNHKTLKAWKAEYGNDVVESWVTA